VRNYCSYQNLKDFWTLSIGRKLDHAVVVGDCMPVTGREHAAMRSVIKVCIVECDMMKP
jgi:hypothetical protein